MLPLHVGHAVLYHGELCGHFTGKNLERSDGACCVAGSIQRDHHEQQQEDT